jgi:hypothetical protein
MILLLLHWWSRRNSQTTRRSLRYPSESYLIVPSAIVSYDLESSSSMNNYRVFPIISELTLVAATDKVQEWLFDSQVDLILVIGTSGVVYPAAGYAWSVKMRGGKVAVFNIETDSDSHADWNFEGFSVSPSKSNDRPLRNPPAQSPGNK